MRYRGCTNAPLQLTAASHRQPQEVVIELGDVLQLSAAQRERVTAIPRQRKLARSFVTAERFDPRFADGHDQITVLHAGARRRRKWFHIEHEQAIAVFLEPDADAARGD